jgi:hypothetical protein
MKFPSSAFISGSTSAHSSLNRQRAKYGVSSDAFNCFNAEISQAIFLENIHAFVSKISLLNISILCFPPEDQII